MNANTAGGLRAASKEVLSAVAGDDAWETLDLTTVEPDDYAQRFERLRMSKFKPASLGVYKARFKNAFQMYLAYLENLSSWRYNAERPSRDRKKAAEPVNTPLTQSPQGRSASVTSDSRATEEESGQKMIEYPFPLRPDCLVKMSLPDNMTAREAERLGAFLKTLAYEPPREITAVSSTAVGQAS